MSATYIPTTALLGEQVPILGQGTWRIGKQPTQRMREIEALQRGIDVGMTLIDTAEMYAEGGSEALIGAAIAERREQVFLISKVLPHHATAQGTVAACEASLRRLKTDYIDLYLLHWRGAVPLSETLAGFAALLQSGKIRYWGVSNFDQTDMEELVSLPDGAEVATNQVLYNLARRGIEWDLLPWFRARQLPLMAYSPLEQGRLLRNTTLQRVAARHAATAAQVALAWLLRQGDVIAIPQASAITHIDENRAAINLQLNARDLSELDQVFPPPTRWRPLEML